jgi:hypothetical protein
LLFEPTCSVKAIHVKFMFKYQAFQPFHFLTPKSKEEHDFTSMDATREFLMTWMLDHAIGSRVLVSKYPTWDSSLPKPVTEFPYDEEINSLISFLTIPPQRVSADFVVVLEPSTPKGCLDHTQREGFVSPTRECRPPDGPIEEHQKTYELWLHLFNGIDQLCGCLPVCEPFAQSVEILMATCRHFLEDKLNRKHCVRIIFATDKPDEIPVYIENLLYYFPPKGATGTPEPGTPEPGTPEPGAAGTPKEKYAYQYPEDHPEEEDCWTIERCFKCKTIVHDFSKSLGGGIYRPQYQCPVCQTTF